MKKIRSGKIKNMTAQDLVPFCMEANMIYTNSSRIPGKALDRVINFDHTKIHHTVVLRYAMQHYTIYNPKKLIWWSKFSKILLHLSKFLTSMGMKDHNFFAIGKESFILFK